MLRTIVIIIFLASSCEENEIRSLENRPSDSEVAPDGYLAETTQSVSANKSATITINKTTIAIPEDGLREDAEVRLRTLESKPDRAEVASLGDAKGDVIELTMYNKGTDEIYASTVLDQPYGASQVLTDVTDEDNLKYVVISAPGTDDELLQVLSRKAITTSTALTAADLSVTIDLSVTHVIFYAVESAEASGSVIVLDSGQDTSNDSGGSVSTSSTSSSSTSSSSSSSSGSSIDCSGKGFDPENEEWIPVPANAAVGQSEDFCVMKFEAKQDLSGKPVSKPSGKPWVDIGQTDAIAKCASLGDGDGYELITNEAWQTIARNIETAQSPPGTYLNWSDASTTGANSLNRGNSNQNAALVADSDDANGCAGITSNSNSDDNCASAWHVNKRTHTLSNGEVIWDLAGNVWEWSSSTLKSQGPSGKISQNLANVPDATAGKLKWGPEGDYYSSKNSGEFGGLGHGYLSGSGGAVRRGGDWDDDTDAGAFAADLNDVPSFRSSNIGFRCISSGGP